MDIRLLGPLEVVADGGTPLPVTAPRLRAVLAALALRAGEVVPTAVLVQQVWGPEPPDDAAATLRDCVARLRRMLPEARLMTEPDGFRLAVVPTETDLGRFHAAVRQARAVAEREPERAAELLARALGLWRGTPLDDVPRGPLRAAVEPPLAELRLAALEDWSELSLTLGRHAEVADDLLAAARAHPHRERLTRQAIAALRRCGRTVEQQVLERALRDAASEARAQLPRARLAPFPSPGATFVARGLELARLRSWLTGASAAPAVCLIDGPGGVGKSTLAVRAAREAADRFPDGLLYVDLRGADPRNPPLDLAEARRVLLASMGTPGKEVPQDPTAAAAFYREQFAARRVLLVLDNALDVAQVGPLLPVEPGSAALVTSRTALTGLAPGRHLHLGPLTTEEAVALVRTVAVGRAERGMRAQWEELVGLCGRLPLALRILAARMAARPRWSVADFIAVLRDERRRMDELTTDDLDLRASLMVSIDQLAAGSEPEDRRAAGMFPLLGAAAVRSFSPGSVAALVGCQAWQARRALERLVEARIAESPWPDVYTLHDLVRSAAAWQAARLPRRGTTERLAELARWYLGSLYRVNVPLALPDYYRRRYQVGADRYPQGRPFTSVDESLPWADEVLDDVISLAQQLSAPEYDAGDELGGAPLSTFSLECVRALESYFGMRLSWRAQRRLCDITLDVGRRRGDRFAQAVAYGQLGKAAGQQGSGDRGVELLRSGIELCRSVDRRMDALVMTLNLVPCLGSAGRLTEAVEVAERALAEVAETGMAEFRPQIINNLGRCQLFLGRHDEARGLLTRNYEAAPLPYERTIAAGVLAEYHLEIGEFEEAARWADRALAHAAEQPFDPIVVAQQRTWRAAALRGLGREDLARAEEMQAQAVLEDLNSRENSHLRVRTDGRHVPLAR
ncbi:BTAD domain-containing putative transcriptional regulator [Streptomyces radicis]|uniref:AfsR/SARP family transcriptional regulator n=1 Tax=Streptomyces radicis TaxID=1750517 RepID=A0A3A9WL52_9ACTN|nr:BTAD domain-containing putative transcriptional regulator [Streptomyces radicis]RKN06877.1 AfsR/SARP family transcriptional regulator [Streptomyces radicis]RKN19495.1 AfsR/SARP family transcriptional regulator [Streptomyces radicis]